MTEQYVEELIRKYAEGTATAAEVQQLLDWYSSSPIGEVQWPSAGISEKEVVSRRMLTRLQDAINPKASAVIRFQWQKIAAILFVFLGVATILIFLLKPSNLSLITVANPSGKIQLVTLPDSSKVWLNASTMIRYAASFRNDRLVRLEGEAYFEVTHDSNHPFVIVAGDLNTTVLGTSFNVKAFEADASTKISVISGRVKVTNNSKELGILSSSDELKYDRQNRTRTINRIDTNDVLAWKHGKLKFNGESFAEMAVVIEGWYGIQVKFADASIARCRYYLSFDNTVPVDSLLSIMKELAGIRYVFNKDKTIVTISGPGCASAF